MMKNYFFLISMLFLSFAMADVRLNPLFSDGMVIQRETLAPVWGNAAPGEKISVSASWGAKSSTTATKDGTWKVELKTPKAGGPFTLTVKGSNTIEVNNVLSGEVWICSGQSNMQMGYGGIPDIKALLPKAKNIRSFKVKSNVAFKEQELVHGEWADAVPPSAVAFAFAYSLQEATNIPVGIIQSAWGSSSIEAWMPRDMTADFPYFKTVMDEFDADEVGRARIEAALSSPKGWSGKDDVYLRRQPNIVYNAMMKPLAPYACRGLVWYQGERNARYISGMPERPAYHRVVGMREYGGVLTKWIQRYRKEWGNDQMHFLVVGMPGFGSSFSMKNGPKVGAQHPDAHSWAWLRESQFQALELSGVSVATTIDLGDEKSIHPKDKLPVGQRLALLARRDALSEELLAEGPVMKKVEQRNGALIVHYNQAKGLKTADSKAPSAFWLADDSGRWVRAEAQIEGETVVLRSPELKRPLYIRYAFAGKPNVNLVNQADLPARPFRTDQFDPIGAQWPGTKTLFHNFDQFNFERGEMKCKVVVPKKVAKGRPWIWRARFFGHQPQADIALLKQGFHVAYVNVSNLFGSPKAVARWDAFYDYLTMTRGLNKKPALEGFSRGGLIVYNWAAANPDKVSCIYADAPVCDLKSWPGGKGTGQGSPKTWKKCLEAYGMTEQEALTFDGNPIDQLQPLAAAGIPLLHVVGDADDVVPVSENTAIIEKRYNALGGSIKVIHKEGVGHHPHSLKDPSPIVEFVLKHTY